MAESLIYLQRWEAAENTYHSIWQRWQELSNLLGMAATACDLAFVLQRTKRGEAAREHITHALALYEQGQFENGLSCARIAAATLYLEQNEPEHAACLLGAASYRPKENFFSLLMPTWVDWAST